MRLVNATTVFVEMEALDARYDKVLIYNPGVIDWGSDDNSLAVSPRRR